MTSIDCRTDVRRDDLVELASGSLKISPPGGAIRPADRSRSEAAVPGESVEETIEETIEGVSTEWAVLNLLGSRMTR